MGQIYFITGYPGLLASGLIQQLLDDHRDDIGSMYLLVLPQMEEAAVKKSTHLARKNDLHPDFFTIITGDITQPGLGLEDIVDTLLRNAVTHVFHLAAIYDLAVSKAIAQNVNVNGTHYVNEWVKTLAHLERYIYFSTAYVSGKREGRIYEHELTEGQGFRNHYEQTKFEAELLVEDLKSTVPTTIMRPGIVKGDSQTGVTAKFDGLYFVLNFLDKMARLPVIPYLGDGEAEGNFVPSDYVLQAASHLSMAPQGEGKTYHLTDPAPYKMRELQQMLSEQYLGKRPKGKLLISWTKSGLSSAAVRKWLGVEKEALDYFFIHSSYDTRQTQQDLEGTGISCPDMKDSLEVMVAFYRKYKDDYQRHITIE